MGVLPMLYKEVKMIPFNLERALAGDKVVDVNCGEVTQFTYFDYKEADALYGLYARKLGNG